MSAIETPPLPAGFMVVRYEAVNRSGAPSYCIRGMYADNIVRFVAEKYAARWRSLKMWNGDGELIGEISRGDNGRRVWWAQSGCLDDATREAAKEGADDGPAE